MLRKEYIGPDVSKQIKFLNKCQSIISTHYSPWYIQEQLVEVYQCGASLIAGGVVLTAGHCVNDTK